MSDADALKEGLPPDARLAIAREEVIPPRTWVSVGVDGIEMYLDADEAARFLVRKVEP